MKTHTHEKYLPVKQLVEELRRQRGLIVSERYVRAMLASGVRRIGYSARFSDLLDWWERHPDFSPRAKKPIKTTGKNET